MTKMCLWSMGQDDEFYDERLNELKYGGGIWNLLSSVLQLSEEQKRKIVGSRGGLKRQQENHCDGAEHREQGAGEGGEEHGVDAEADAGDSRGVVAIPAGTVFVMDGE